MDCPQHGGPCSVAPSMRLSTIRRKHGSNKTGLWFEPGQHITIDQEQCDCTLDSQYHLLLVPSLIQVKRSGLQWSHCGVVLDGKWSLRRLTLESN